MKMNIAFIYLIQSHITYKEVLYLLSLNEEKYDISILSLWATRKSKKYTVFEASSFIKLEFDFSMTNEKNVNNGLI